MRELNLNPGDTLFIAGASGAIGTLVIQLAKAKGIRIAASASIKNQEYMKLLGAEKTVAYHDPDRVMKIKSWSDGGVDTALAIQPGTGTDSIQTIKDNGRLITVSGDANAVPPQRNITIKQMAHQLGTTELSQLVQAVAKDDLKVIIEQEYKFKDSLEALEKTETRHARGKVMVNVQDQCGFDHI